MSQQFNFENLVALCRRTHDQTQRSAARAIDRSLVARNWLFGWYIVEYEQHGADRAEYGSQILNRVSSRLQQIGIKGSSITRLKLYRRFYQQQKGIGPTVSAQLASLAYGDGISALFIRIGQRVSIRRKTKAVYFRQPPFPCRSRFIQPAAALLRSN